MGFQRYAKRRLRNLHLHELEGEGHLSWFCHNDANHRQVSSLDLPMADVMSELRKERLEEKRLGIAYCAFFLVGMQKHGQCEGASVFHFCRSHEPSGLSFNQISLA
jgi:hypothetical protein